jgi:nitrate/TMAO reductase-like tetraheme cytochrome c subunit
MKQLLSRKIILGSTVGAALFFMIVGVIFWGGFNTAMEATNTLDFCISCHEMKDNVYKEYEQTIHYNNRSGVRATCSDCHVPDPWVHKVVRKIQASNEVLHKVLGTINTPEKFDAKRLKMASNVWRAMKETDSRECRNCHDYTTMQPANQKPRARKQHLNGMTAGNTCIDCHKGIAHKEVHDQLSEEELDAISAPDPELAIEIPQHWQDFLDQEEAQKEAEKEAKRLAAEQAAAEAALAAEQAAVAAEQQAATAAPSASESAAAPASSGALASAGSSVNWAAVTGREVILFYPGQSSMEWILGRKHGGKRAFTKGDRCVDCHEEELHELGRLITTGESEKDLEPNPIPGKRGSIAVDVKAAHDGSKLYMRFAWTNTDHTPASFVDGGKMDPKNQVKLALMLATDEVEYADRAGCWGTCHADANSMPTAPDGQDVTKYLTESRTEIELKGRSKPLGGWDKRKPDADIKAEFEAGHFMDIARYKSGEKASEDGYILADREMTADSATEFTARLEGDRWVVEMVRPLKTGNNGDLELAGGELYNIGFAIHDDYTSARYHHVSLGYKFGLDNDEAEINAQGL